MASSTWRLTTRRSGRNAYQATRITNAANGIAIFIHFFMCVSPRFEIQSFALSAVGRNRHWISLSDIRVPCFVQPRCQEEDLNRCEKFECKSLCRCELLEMSTRPTIYRRRIRDGYSSLTIRRHADMESGETPNRAALLMSVYDLSPRIFSRVAPTLPIKTPPV